MQIDVDGALAALRFYQRNPVRWTKEVLGIDLWTAQAEIMQSIVDNRITAAKSCHGIGKSLEAAVVVLWWLYTHAPAKVVTTAPSKRQVDGIIWSEVAKLHKRAAARGSPLNGVLGATKLTLSADHFAWGFTAPDYDPNRFQGFHSENMLVIADEACGVMPAIFEGIDSLMTGENARMLLIGNPTDESGDFGNAFKQKGVSKFSVDAFQTPNFTAFGITLADIRSGEWKDKITGPMPTPWLVSPHWVREKWEKWGEDSPLFISRVLAKFPDVSDDKLIPLSWVEAANARWEALEEATEAFPPSAVEYRGWVQSERLGQDVARYGSDSSVTAVGHYTATKRQGIRQLVRKRKLSTTELVGHILHFVKQEGEGVVRQIRIDGDGLGAGPFDQLHDKLGSMVVEMRGGMRARDPDQFINARAEWFWKLREDLNPEGKSPIALPFDDDLTTQLTAIQYRINPKGLIQIESKEDMRARGMPSPDEADAVAYCNAEVVDVALVMPDPTVGFRTNPLSQE
jgi:hypothetical protein